MVVGDQQSDLAWLTIWNYSRERSAERMAGTVSALAVTEGMKLFYSCRQAFTRLVLLFEQSPSYHPTA